jgi:hypothetical protein
MSLRVIGQKRGRNSQRRAAHPDRPIGARSRAPPNPFAATGWAPLGAGAPKIGARGSFHGPPQTHSRFSSVIFPAKIVRTGNGLQSRRALRSTPRSMGRRLPNWPRSARLLPAGAFAGWGLHPLESAALSRRTRFADVADHGLGRLNWAESGHSCEVVSAPAQGPLLVPRGPWACPR